MGRGKPTVYTGWWLLLLKERANGKVGLLAHLCGVTTRTLHRWQCGNIAQPEFQRCQVIRGIAGLELLRHSLCPKYLRRRGDNA